MATKKRVLNDEQKAGAREAAARYRLRKKQKGYVALQVLVPEWIRAELAEVIQDYVDVRLAEQEEAAAEKYRQEQARAKAKKEDE